MSAPAKTALPPGPKHHWLLGTGIGQVKDPLGQLVRGQQQHGDIVYFRMHHGPSWLLSHPDHAQYVLADNASNFLSMVGDGPDPLLGRGLFASQGDFWRRQRRMVSPSFHRPRLARMVEGMVRDVHALADEWTPLVNTGTPVELLAPMRRLALRMLGTSIFSEDVYASQEELRQSMDTFARLVHGPRDSLLQAIAGLLRLHGGRARLFFGAVEQLNRVFYRLIAERRQSPAGKEDVMAMLMEVRDNQGVAMTDTELRDELVNLYVGGYESTAVALTWILYEVARHPEVEQRVRDEVARLTGGQPLTAESLQSLHYTRAVVEETLRVHPPAWNFVRRTLKEDRIGEWTLAPDTKILISPYILHRHPAFWQEPERYMPERFLSEQKEGRHRFAYLPFGAGQRQCVGIGYTLTLLTISLATLVQRHQLRLAPKHPVIAMAGSTRRPRDGVVATLHPAPPAA